MKLDQKGIPVALTDCRHCITDIMAAFIMNNPYFCARYLTLDICSKRTMRGGGITIHYFEHPNKYNQMSPTKSL